MTVVLALRCADGIVVASDSQITDPAPWSQLSSSEAARTRKARGVGRQRVARRALRHRATVRR